MDRTRGHLAVNRQCYLFHHHGNRITVLLNVSINKLEWASQYVCYFSSSLVTMNAWDPGPRRYSSRQTTRLRTRTLFTHTFAWAVGTSAVVRQSGRISLDGKSPPCRFCPRRWTDFPPTRRWRNRIGTDPSHWCVTTGWNTPLWTDTPSLRQYCRTPWTFFHGVDRVVRGDKPRCHCL